MSIDIDGGMIVGELASKVKKPDDYHGYYSEWIEIMGMERYSLWYDSGVNGWVVGFPVEDVDISEISGDWLLHVKGLAAKFKTLTGVQARLIGCQNVW